MKLHGDIPCWGEPIDAGALEQIQRCRETALHCALMPDHHLGYAVPIGGVVGYEDAISPSGVGYDIGCGNKAVRLDAPAAEVRARIGTIMDDVFSTLSFGMGQKNGTKVDHALFDDPRWSNPGVRDSKSTARDQLGTIGGGNHYVDIFIDEQDRVWVGVHFGSRGFGHRTASYFLKKGGAKDAIHAAPLVLPVSSDLGAEYIEDMQLAGLYAYAGRDWVCQQVARMIGASIIEEVHNHHNFAWRENHDGRWMWVVRKGATPAWPGQRGFIGGSMGEAAYIVEGSQDVLSYDASMSLRSTVHGAGRAMSRTAAKGKFVKDENGKKQRTPGLVRHDSMMEWVAAAGVTLRGADVDEAPQAYKRLHTVLSQGPETIRIIHTLSPIGVAMAGKEVFDPYKD